MALELQGLKRALLLLAACGAAAGGEFTHRLHLTLKLGCTDCHIVAPTSTKAEDNLLPRQGVCTKCHVDEAVGKPRTTMVVHFSHALHLQMGNVAPVIAAAIDKKTYLQPPGKIRNYLDTKNACVACHRGMEEPDPAPVSSMPQMADCLVCHTEIDNPFSCEKCHAKEANLKPANHVTGFLSDHTSGKMNLDKTTCAVCHGRTFRCLGCH